MEDYQSNSFKSRGEKKDVPEKKVNKVVTGSTKVKKKNEMQKFTEAFISEDVDNVKNYILEDVLIPAIKNVLLDVVKTLLGFSGSSSESKTPASRVSYRRYWDDRDSSRSYSDRRRSGYDYGRVICESRSDAETILRSMDELIDVYGMASVADLYESAGMSGNYTDNNYGWSDIKEATIARTREGYEIKMPKAFPLN